MLPYTEEEKESISGPQQDPPCTDRMQPSEEEITASSRIQESRHPQKHKASTPRLEDARTGGPRLCLG